MQIKNVANLYGTWILAEDIYAQTGRGRSYDYRRIRMRTVSKMYQSI